VLKFNAHLLWRAERDIDHIVAWLNERSPQGAASWLRAWDQTFARLESSADQHGLAPESEGHSLEIRQIMFRTRKGRDYRALYTIRGSDVYVMHSRAPGHDLVPADELQLPEKRPYRSIVPLPGARRLVDTVGATSPFSAGRLPRERPPH
jgi:plasmid stabilization system protein ParE